MIQVRKSMDRGEADYGWLQTRYTFSFAHYHDPAHMGFGNLRVINEDWVAPGTGFPDHPHRDMEILTVVLDGAVEHKDSAGNETVIRAGEVQRMTAGRGIVHSEANPFDEPLHLFQVWIHPRERGLEPGYEQKAFPRIACAESLRLLASADGRDGSLTVHQDVELWAGKLEAGKGFPFQVPEGKSVWVQLASGALELNDVSLETGDGAAVSQETTLNLHAEEATEVLLFIV